MRLILAAAIIILSLSSLVDRPTNAPIRVILNADDAGISPEVNRAVIDLMNSGDLKSASIIVPGESFDEIAKYAEQNPDKDWGVHLTLTSEWKAKRWRPVTPLSKVPSLVDKDGYFWKTSEEAAKNADLYQAEKELTAQIELARRRGINLSHLDSHMHSLFWRCDLLRLYIRLGIRYRLPILLQDSEGESTNTIVSETLRRCPFEKSVADAIQMPFFNLYDVKNYRVEAEEKSRYFERLLFRLPKGVSLVSLHPAHGGESILSLMSAESASRRAADLALFSDPILKHRVANGEIEIISWRDFAAAL